MQICAQTFPRNIKRLKCTKRVCFWGGACFFWGGGFFSWFLVFQSLASFVFVRHPVRESHFRGRDTTLRLWGWSCSPSPLEGLCIMFSTKPTKWGGRRTHRVSVLCFFFLLLLSFSLSFLSPPLFFPVLIQKPRVSLWSERKTTFVSPSIVKNFETKQRGVWFKKPTSDFLGARTKDSEPP